MNITDEDIAAMTQEEMTQSAEIPIDQVATILWGATTHEDEVFIQLPETEKTDLLAPLTLSEIQQHSLKDKNTLLLILWIQGN